jgi:hypothetical protein
MTNITECFKYSQTEKKAILNAFKWYESMRRESLTDETLSFWILEFENMKVPADEVLEKIKKTAKKELYGFTKFSDFLENNDFYDLSDFNKNIEKKINTILKNLYNISIQDIYDYKQKQVQEQIHSELEENFIKVNEELNKYNTDLSERDKQLKKAQIEVLEWFVEKYDIITAIEINKKINNLKSEL